MRRTLQISVALAAVLSVVAPLLHLHYRAPAECAGSLSPTPAASHCVACTAYHGVELPSEDLNAPEQSTALVITDVESTDVVVVLARSSRAPPQLLG